jgi:hypothetical protein
MLAKIRGKGVAIVFKKLGEKEKEKGNSFPFFPQFQR